MEHADCIDHAYGGEPVRFVVRGWPNVSSGAPAIVTPPARWECEFRGRTHVLFDVYDPPIDTPLLREQLLEALRAQLR